MNIDSNNDVTIWSYVVVMAICNKLATCESTMHAEAPTTRRFIYLILCASVRASVCIFCTLLLNTNKVKAIHVPRSVNAHPSDASAQYGFT